MIEAPVWELESRAGRRHQPNRRGRCGYHVLRPLSGTQPAWLGLAAGLAPVANDPKPTGDCGFRRSDVTEYRAINPVWSRRTYHLGPLLSLLLISPRTGLQHLYAARGIGFSISRGRIGA